MVQYINVCEGIWLFWFCRRAGFLCIAQKQMCQISDRGLSKMYQDRYIILSMFGLSITVWICDQLPLTASGLGLDAVCVRVGLCFCTVPVDGQDVRVTINLSRWLCPDKRRGLLPVQKLADGDAKTMTT